MKRLYRSPNDRKLAGVCGGLGEYFDLDPVFFRLLFIVLVFFGGIGLLAYLVMCVMVPMKLTAPRSHCGESAAPFKIGSQDCGGLRRPRRIPGH